MLDVISGVITSKYDMINSINHIIRQMYQENKWIWQKEEYPNFVYNKLECLDLLQKIKYQQGLLNGIYIGFNRKDLLDSQLEILSQEAIKTSQIEGEYLNRDSVRSSIAKKLNVGNVNLNKSTLYSDGLIDMLLDSSKNNEIKFTLQRLFGWHNSLFPTGYSGLVKIKTAQFRGEDTMQIVSGAIGKEKVHYVAPPRDQLDNQMQIYLTWLDNNQDLSIIKAAIAHLWFVIIHPFEDGNGRIARAISDMVLAREAKQDFMLYSMSHAIFQDRTNYYKILERVTKSGVNISAWIEWFLQTLLKALIEAKQQINYILEKTKFWDLHKNTVFNERQLKLLNKMLDLGFENFEGGINTRKYASLCKTSKPTASRELKDLVAKGCLVKRVNTAGRNISYDVLI